MKTKKVLVFDLFSGAGGLSLGAARAGFSLNAAVEIDKHAIACHRENFPSVQHFDIGVESLSGKDIRRIAAGRPFGIIGGPPCQGFSRIGKRDPHDVRNSLFFHFFRIIKEAKPDFYLAENVPGILDADFDALRQTALNEVHAFHNLIPTKFNASHFGAATSRERVFFIGFKNAPKDTALAERAKRGATITTVETALIGLNPQVNPDWQNEACSWRRVSKYPDSAFFNAVRELIPDGVGSRKGLERLRKQSLVSGFLGTRHTPDVVRRFARTEPGKAEPVSRAQRLKNDGFCPTLRAGTDSSRGSFQALRPIHPTQDRMITPREAARLQGFPDWFVFSATKWHSFRQIGNSVSPLLSTRVLTAISEVL